MSNRLTRGVRAAAGISKSARMAKSASGALAWRDVYGSDRGSSSQVSADAALKVSAFYRAIDIRSDSIGKYPVTVRNLSTRKEVENHYLGPLLWERVNEAMTPFSYNKLVEYQRVVIGNCYVWIYRDRSGRPVELLPLPPGSCSPQIEPHTGKLWYIAQDPKSGQLYKLDPADILHFKGFTTNGVNGISLLTYASRTLSVASARDEYEGSVYLNGGHPGGILYTDTDLSHQQDLVLADGTKVSYKDVMRNEWEKVHSGPGNAFRVAILDNGLKYQAVNMSNSDAQFIESKGVTVEDIARFTGVPLHKLYTGKQSYQSNEANSIDYVTDTMHPAVVQYEQECSYKLLTISERRNHLWLPRNMMAELRADSKTRAEWYKAMRELGAYSVNDILEKEDLPDVPGGDTRLASLNFVPLELFAELSMARNKALEKWAQLRKMEDNL